MTSQKRNDQRRLAKDEPTTRQLPPVAISDALVEILDESVQVVIQAEHIEVQDLPEHLLGERLWL